MCENEGERECVCEIDSETRVCKRRNEMESEEGCVCV